MPTCRACNVLLTPKESSWNEETKEHGDLCYFCGKVSDDTADDTYLEPVDYVLDGGVVDYD